MVNLDKNESKLLINRHFDANCTKVVLINKLTRDELQLENLVDQSDSDFFYEFNNVDLSSLTDGEYIVALSDENDEPIETMLGVCGDFERSVTTYIKEINHIVYERD